MQPALDTAALVVGCASIVSIFVFAQTVVSTFICCCAGILGIIYIIYGVSMFSRRICMDWHLQNGHFLRKVCCLAILMPSVVNLFFLASNVSSDNIFFDTDTHCMEYTYLQPKDVTQKQFYDYMVELGELEAVNDTTYRKAVVSLDETEENPSAFWGIYYHFIDPGNQHMAKTVQGRAWTAVCAILGYLLLNGLFITSLIGWLDGRKEKWLNGEIRYTLRQLGKNRFAVIIGGNEIAASAIENLLTANTVTDNINFKCEGDNDYVVLQTCRDPQIVREELSARLSDEYMRRVVVYKALRHSLEELKNLHLEYATEIYVLGESVTNEGGETFHDTLNMKCVNLIADILEEAKSKNVYPEQKTVGEGVENLYIHRKVCKVMFEYQTTFSIFQFSDITETVKKNLVFIPFNRYESWARRVIVDGVATADCASDNYIEYTPLDGYEGIAKDSNEFVHFIVVGMSKMGIAMGTQAMLQAHYLNFNKKKSRITFIDVNASQEMEFFQGRYSNLFELARHRFIDCSESHCPYKKCKLGEPWIDPIEKTGSKWTHLTDGGKNFIDIEIEFVKGAVESHGIREYLCEAVNAKDVKVTIAICLPQAHQAIAASLYMPTEVYKSERLQEIWVYQNEAADIITNLTQGVNNDLRYNKLRPFGMLYGEYMNDRTQYLKSVLVNAAYDISNDRNREWPKDLTNKHDANYTKIRNSWKALPVPLTWSNKFFVDSIYLKIKNVMVANMADATQREALAQKYGSYSRIVKLFQSAPNCLQNIETAFNNDVNKILLAECEHNRWNIQQLLLGFSACDEELDAMFADAERGEDISSRFSCWCDKNLGMKPDLTATKPKKLVKASALKLHPNICDYNHLDVVDKGAKPYDMDLNNAIPTILRLVDLRPTAKS